MTLLIRKCPKCGDYTMKQICDHCYEKTYIAHPPKYSPDDKWRFFKARKMKSEAYGLLKELKP